MTATLQSQARALGDPTRHGVFSYLVDADRPVDVAELTDHFGLNHNAIRQHLARLVDAGLVEGATAPSTGRGRPRRVYRVSPHADSRWGATGPYERLTVLLAEALRTGATPEEVGRRAVVESEPAPPAGADPVDVVTAAMARHGFDPEVRRRGDSVEMALRACPFESAAVADPEVVCAVHLGMAEGIAELAHGRVVVDALVPHDPRRHPCRLRLHLEPGRDPAPGGTP